MTRLRLFVSLVGASLAGACYQTPSTLGQVCSEDAACTWGELCIEGRCAFTDGETSGDDAESDSLDESSGAASLDDEGGSESSGGETSGGDEGGLDSSSTSDDGGSSDDTGWPDDGTDDTGEEPSEPVCSNGVVEGAETCDGKDLDGQSCADFGFGGGTLSCDGACQLDLSDCCLSTGQSCGLLGSCCGGLSCNPLTQKCQ